MKKILVSALVLTLLLGSFTGRGNKYRQIDVPKELKIDEKTLSEDTDELLSIDDTTPLLTALPDEGLYIYYTDRTVKSGVLVKYDGMLQFFAWRFTPELARPDVYIADYNGDGEKDIAFTYVSEVGETQFCENLHLLLRTEDKFEDRYYTGEKASIQCGNHLVVAPKGDDKYIAYIDGEPTEFTLTGHGEFSQLYLKHIQDFTLGETITVELDPGLVFVGESSPVFSTFRYIADVVPTDGDVKQQNARITFE